MGEALVCWAKRQQGGDIAPDQSMTVYNMNALSVGAPAARVSRQEVAREKLVPNLGKRL